MTKLDVLIEEARELDAVDRQRLVDAIRPSPGPEPEPRSTGGLRQRPEGLEMFLALAGTATSDYTDVSSDKYRHLAEIDS